MSGRRLSASLYVRLSKTANPENLSYDGMMDDLRALAARLDCDIVAEHGDDGISGAVRDRPEFLAWLDDARTGLADVLLCPHADRLSREGVNAAAMILDVVEGKDPTTGKLVRPPVRLVDTDGLDSQSGDSFRWRFVIAAEVARAERERMRARNSATRRRLKEAGRWAGGSVPFGCRVVERGGQKALERHDEEAAVLEEAAERLIAGASMRAVTRWLNAQGYRTRRGKEWIRSSLRATLLSEATREHVLDLATRRVLEERLRSGPSEAPSGGRPQRWLLAGGLAECPSGTPLTTSAGRYVCSAYSEGRVCPTLVSIDARAVDEHVTSEFLRRFGRLRHMEPRLILHGAEALDEAERAAQRAQECLLAEPGPETLAVFQEAQKRLQTAQSLPQSRERTLVETGKTIKEVWEERDVPERAALLDGVLEGPVVIRPGGPGRRRGVTGAVVDLSRVEIPWRMW